MRLLFAALLAAQSPDEECAAALTFRGVGAIAASQVQPYVHCLNANMGRPERLRAMCSEARAKAADYTGPDTLNVARAIEWLDAMVQARSNCETDLQVEA
jgi:hypothetical protein